MKRLSVLGMMKTLLKKGKPEHHGLKLVHVRRSNPRSNGSSSPQCGEFKALTKFTTNSSAA